MNKLIKKNMYLLANKTVYESRLFIDPQIKYIFMKNERKPQFVIGIYDPVDEIECIFNSVTADESISLENLKYSHPIFSEETGVCEEGYLLSLMDEKYESIFIDIPTHAKLWDFIDYYMDILDSKEDMIIKYLEFSRSSGINSILLSEYSDSIINNLYAIYLKDEKMILSYNKCDNYVYLDHDENGYIIESLENPKGTTYRDFKSAFYDFLSIVLNDITSTHSIQEELNETLIKLGEKKHE